MKHSLNSQSSSSEDVNYEISVLELDNELVNISITRESFVDFKTVGSNCINLDKKELHSLIGTLLHVQAKMKGGYNGNR